MSTLMEITHAGCTLRAVERPLSSTHADALVNPANQSMNHRAGVALELLQADGPNMQTETRRKLHTCYPCGKMDVGECLSTKSNNLRCQCQYIIHTVAPDCRVPEQNKNRATYVKRATKSALDEARRLCCRSIAFPLLGTKQFGMHAEESVQEMVLAIKQWIQQFPCCMGRIDFVDCNMCNLQIVVSEVRKQMFNCGTCPPSAMTPSCDPCQTSSPDSYGSSMNSRSTRVENCDPCQRSGESYGGSCDYDWKPSCQPCGRDSSPKPKRQSQWKYLEEPSGLSDCEGWNPPCGKDTLKCSEVECQIKQVEQKLCNFRDEEKRIQAEIKFGQVEKQRLLRMKDNLCCGNDITSKWNKALRSERFDDCPPCPPDPCRQPPPKRFDDCAPCPPCPPAPKRFGACDPCKLASDKRNDDCDPCKQGVRKNLSWD